ncbi:hypothetical protein N7489_002618 [Penicillium chrysogenum]|uniref:uncharacterized protein n=1 Tax=Penicillium chrysogenum TaxID=5076 RepID=UPI0024DF148D|nr:uncharacterized protein N7489_002618 [Penicillium chrysogenum]KAJ5252208.1 hypothetical protein N7489_002618 [Penicillium chrysogenum]
MQARERPQCTHAFFGASAFHGWVETAKYLSAPGIFYARLIVTLNTQQVPDEQVQSRLIQCPRGMWASTIYAVQRHGTTFDTYRSLPGIHQITLRRRRIESASSTGFKFPGLRDPNAAARSLNHTPLVGS